MSEAQYLAGHQGGLPAGEDQYLEDIPEFSESAESPDESEPAEYETIGRGGIETGEGGEPGEAGEAGEAASAGMGAGGAAGFGVDTGAGAGPHEGGAGSRDVSGEPGRGFEQAGRAGGNPDAHLLELAVHAGEGKSASSKAEGAGRAGGAHTASPGAAGSEPGQGPQAASPRNAPEEPASILAPAPASPLGRADLPYLTGPWNRVLPSMEGAPESAFDLDRAARVLTRLKPVERWDAVVVAAHVNAGGKQTPLVPGTAKGVPGCMYLFMHEAAVQAVFGADPQAAAAQAKVELKAGRLVTLLREGFEAGPACGGFLIYGLADDPARAGVPAFLPAAALTPIEDTLVAILVLARARNGQISSQEVRASLGARTFFYQGHWLGEGDVLPAIEVDGVPTVALYFSPKTLLKAATRGIGASAPQAGSAGSGGVGAREAARTGGARGGLGANLATITLAEALERVPEGARVVLEPGAGYSVAL